MKQIIWQKLQRLRPTKNIEPNKTYAVTGEADQFTERSTLPVRHPYGVWDGPSMRLINPFNSSSRVRLDQLSVRIAQRSLSFIIPSPSIAPSVSFPSRQWTAGFRLPRNIYIQLFYASGDKEFQYLAHRLLHTSFSFNARRLVTKA